MKYAICLCFVFFLFFHLEAQFPSECVDTSNPSVCIVNCTDPDGCALSDFALQQCGSISELKVVSDNKIIAISGKLVVDVSWEVTGGTEIFMAPGAEILVKGRTPLVADLSGDIPNVNQVINYLAVIAAVNLRLENSSIIGCGAMWKGITFESGNVTVNSVIKPTIQVVNIDNASIEDAEIGMNISSNLNLSIENSFFENNIRSLTFGDLRSFKLDNTKFRFTSLKSNYPGQMTYNNEIVGVETKMNSLILGFKDVKNSMFSNLNRGVIVSEKSKLSVIGSNFSNISETAIEHNKSFGGAIDGNTFNNCQYGLLSHKVIGDFSIVGNTFNDNIVGVSLTESTPTSLLIIQSNTFNGNVFQNDIGLRLDGISPAAVVISIGVFNNIEEGIVLYNIDYDNLLVLNNTFGNCKSPLKISNVIPSVTGSLQAQIKDNITSTSNWYPNGGILAHNTSGIVFEENKIEATLVGVNTGALPAINIFGNSDLNDFVGNEVSVEEFTPKMYVRNSMGNTLCCNTLEGLNPSGITNTGFGLGLSGTNALTALNQTIQNTGVFSLNQTMIGTQDNSGNRWLADGSIGILSNTNIDQAADQNSFLINLAESNSSSGLIRPAIVSPSSIENLWFENMPFGSSVLCGDSNSCDVASGGGGMGGIPPFYDPGSDPCFPTELDIDGDGICDSLDPDPEDSCIPNGTDTDGDGICDSVDPDPLDGCIPFAYDIDGDGICNGGDPDPLDPCVPNGVDTDGDGVCDVLDPNPSDSNLPIINPSYPIYPLDCNGNTMVTNVFNNGVPSYTIDQLKLYTEMQQGTHEYEELNFWEGKMAAMEVLYKNSYYQKVSPDLTSFFENPSNQIFKDYVEAKYLMECINTINHNDHVEIVKLSNTLARNEQQIVEYIDATADSIIIENLANHIMLKANELDSLQSLSNNHRLSKINAAISSIQVLSEPFDFLDERKMTWLLQLKVLFLKDVLTAAEMNSLWTVANECPLVYGATVYDAQGLLVYLDQAEWHEFSDDCEGTLPRSQNVRESTNSSSYRVMPNPSYGSISIGNNSLDEELLKIEIFNSQGKLIYSAQEYTEGSDINLGGFKSGIYFATVISDSGKVDNCKFILIE